VILRSLGIAGFGRLRDRRFTFGPGLNVIFGANESGKSTLCAAIAATLYGLERRKELWRPWDGGPFVTTLAYTLADGREIEVARDYDAKVPRVYDRNGTDLAAELGEGRALVPGKAHLGIGIDAFWNAAYVRQQQMPIDEGKDASVVADALAHALDGGPREDAARGALKRIDDALRQHVGTKHARKNAPLRALRERLDENQRTAIAARDSLARLDELRARIEHLALERERLTIAVSEAERRVRGRRAGLLRARLADLRAWREQFAEVQAARAVFDDVATFDADREGEAIDAYHAALTAAALAERANEDAERARLSEEETHELANRRADAGRVDDAAFAEITQAAQTAAAARARAATAASEARSVRPIGAAGGFFGALLALGLVALCAAVGFAIAHDWFWTPVCGAIAVALLGISGLMGRGRAVRVRSASAQQQRADEALAAESRAAAAIAAILDPLGVLNVEDLSRRRDRLADLEAKYTAANAALARAEAARHDAAAAGEHFDRIAAALVPDVHGPRPDARAAIVQRSARKRERDGIDARLSFLDVQRSTILGSEDGYALEIELAELLAAGVEPLEDDTLSLRAIEDERATVVDALRGVERELAALQGELTGAERAIPDLPELDETIARTEAEIARLEAFERALTLAKETLAQRTDEAHSSFARRLEDYAAGTFSTITAGRYGELRVNPATLEITVRIPETQAIEKIEFLSAGTRDQAYLVVRFAMARMFAEGGEAPPLLLDDPFAYWDAQRIERCLPIVERGALDGQTLLFTSSEELARAAAARGAQRIDLSAPMSPERSAERASGEVVVDQAAGLHERIDDGRADEPEAAPLQILADALGER